MKLLILSFALALEVGTASWAQTPATTGPITVDSAAPVVRSSEVPKQPTAFYRDAEGKPVVKRGAEVKDAPPNALIVQFEDFALGGRAAYRRITIPKGRAYIPHGGTDMVGYLVKGKLGLKLGNVKTEVGEGDTWRRIALQDNLYTALEEVVILEAEAAPDRRDTATLYTQTCAGCHGATGAGTERGTSLRNARDPAKNRDVIAHGRGPMQPFSGQLSGEEIAQLSSYVAAFGGAASARSVRAR